MYKKSVVAFTLITLAAGFSACGPAAEDRGEMHRRAKIISDSMANLIRVAMQEAEMPAMPAPPPAPVTATTAPGSATAANQPK